MFSAATLVGSAVQAVEAMDGAALAKRGIGFDCTLLLGGQIAGRPPRLYLIYAAGNFIEATPDTPFLQIGEHKYGKPILDRVVTARTSLEEAVALTLISMDSAIRSSLSIGLPLNLAVVRTGPQLALRLRITDEDPYYRIIREGWSDALREAYQGLPRPDHTMS